MLGVYTLRWRSVYPKLHQRIRRAADCSIPNRSVSEGQFRRSLTYGLVALVKSLLGKGGKTDFLVRQWGIRRTRKSVVPLKQQALTYRVMIGSFQSAACPIGWFPSKIALRFATKTVKLMASVDRDKWVPRIRLGIHFLAGNEIVELRQLS